MAKEAQALVAISVVVVALNWLSAKALGFPFLYCWGGYLAAPAYQAFGTVLLYVIVAYTVFYIMRGNLQMVVAAVMLFVAVVEVPRLADAVFRLGGSCG